MGPLLSSTNKTIVIDVMVNNGDKFYGQLAIPKRPWKLDLADLRTALYDKFPSLIHRTDVVLAPLD